jgi:mitochondrial fission protein ELM1
MPPLKALLLSDGRPGHYHLAEGILAAAARRREIEVVRLEVRRPRWLPGRLLSWLTNGGVAPARVLSFAYGVDAARLPPADLVVSAGGDTLAANVAAAKLLGAANIFYGSLRRYRPEDFSLALTSYARQATRPNQLMTLKPSPADPDLLLRAAPASRPGPGRPPRLAGLLIGGSAGAIQFSRGDWEHLIAFLTSQHHADATRWIVSNSRRTPEGISDALERLSLAAGGPLEEFIDVRKTGAGTLGGLFARSEAILCTADSSSMLSEAVWLRRPALAIVPELSSLSSDERGYRAYLEANGWARELSVAELSPERFLAELGRLKPLAANPLDLLAAALAERLPALFPA